MPSPIAHIAAGYAVSVAFGREAGRAASNPGGRISGLPLFATVLCLLPDSTSVLGLLTGNFARYHNSWEHSLLVGVGVAFVLAAIAWSIGDRRYRRWPVIALLCYESHVVMDYFTIGRGVMLFWPVSPERWQPPVHLFYGLHWSDGWLTVRHLWTALTELVFGALVVLAVSILARRFGRAR